MHRTEGDGFKVDPIGGQNVFADEDLPTRDATQLRYQEANTYQEEIANVILQAGMSLNASSETVQQMIQLRDAIDILIGVQVSAEAAIRLAADNALALLISPNTTHRGSDGKNHSDVVLNNAHRISDGKNHSDVVLNNGHRVNMQTGWAAISTTSIITGGTIANDASYINYSIFGNRLHLHVVGRGDLSGTPTDMRVDISAVPGIAAGDTYAPTDNIGTITQGGAKTLALCTPVAFNGFIFTQFDGSNLPIGVDVKAEWHGWLSRS